MIMKMIDYTMFSCKDKVNEFVNELEDTCF